MKALSVRAPWSELIARGDKTIEVRSKRTHHRGPLLICSGVSWAALGVELHGRIGERGVSVCLVDLVDCRPIELSDTDAACFDVRRLKKPHFAWVLENARRVDAVPILGQLSMFIPPVMPRIAA
ncbi:MAG TPA: ASCH domain-containing protein [Gemmatimonadaceae bacterium]